MYLRSCLAPPTPNSRRKIFCRHHLFKLTAAQWRTKEGICFCTSTSGLPVAVLMKYVLPSCPCDKIIRTLPNDSFARLKVSCQTALQPYRYSTILWVMSTMVRWTQKNNRGYRFLGYFQGIVFFMQGTLTIFLIIATSVLCARRM